MAEFLVRELLDWSKLGEALRCSAEDAFGPLEHPSIGDAYQFLVENPECFGQEEWPADMPEFPPIELVTAYYRVGEEVSRG